MPIDPAYADFLADPRNTVWPPPPHVPMEKVRRAANAAMSQGVAPEMVEVIDGNIPAEGRAIPFRHYRPVDAPSLPVIFFFHGGGFVWGSIETHDGICRRLARETGAAVLSVGYRLAPETPYPGAVDDAVTAVHAILNDAQAHRIDGKRFALCGDSAGGHVALTACFRLLEAGIAPRYLALIYPALDPACGSDSQHQFHDGPVLTRPAMQWFWSCYLGASPPGSGEVPALRDLTGLPATTILTAEIDPLRDEGIKFAERLAESGIEVRSVSCAGLVHGFLSLPIQTESAERYMRQFVFEPLHAALSPSG